MNQRVVVDVDCVSGEGLTIASHSIVIEETMLMKIGRLLVLQRGLLPDQAMDAFPVSVRVEHENQI